MQRIHFILTIILLFFAPLTSAASWYQVEVIIFDRIDPRTDGEVWPDKPLSLPSNMVELQTADLSTAKRRPIPYMLLGKEHYRLAGLRDMFRFSSDYRLLTHLSWQQPATKGHQSRYVHLQVLADGQGRAFISDNLIDGAIRIRSGFYLHADVDFSYFKQLLPEQRIVRTGSGPFAGAGTEKTIIKLEETRRIKLNEIHYFDHPLYGVILRVNRFQVGAPVEASASN